ncbi:MAG: hypothetical protein QNJ46_18270 [Leptolyngbyaceae cyanobacterium MO_188.B28]|nr:hypothetical protein [Leptolyngbyaceae cyanobacterium MO_188.B28]
MLKLHRLCPLLGLGAHCVRGGDYPLASPPKRPETPPERQVATTQQ